MKWYVYWLAVVYGLVMICSYSVYGLCVYEMVCLLTCSSQYSV
jgi:hypothetical protein